MRCPECGEETADPATPCAWCGAPAAGQPPVMAGPAAGVVGGAAGAAAPTAIVASAAVRALPEPYVPGRGDEIPAGIRRVRRGYSWMASGAVFGGLALFAAGGYFGNLNDFYPLGWLFAATIALWVLAAILVVLRIRLSRFLRRPSEASGATVAACGRGGRTLMLDAPDDGYPSGLKVRLAWWAEPELLPPGQSVTFYGRPGGAGRVLVSSSAQGRALTGIGRRRTVSPVGRTAVQAAPLRPGAQRAGRRYLRWAPLGIAGAGFVVAVAAWVIAVVPSLTGHLQWGQLRAGDCLTGSGLPLGTSSSWPYWSTAVPCTQPHIAEVFFAGNVWPRSVAYPGYNAISGQAQVRCDSAFQAYDGLASSDSQYWYQYTMPIGADDWASGDRLVMCVAYLPNPASSGGGLPIKHSIKRNGQ